MNTMPRAYQTETDLQKMCALLQAGYSAHADAYYIHIGELYLCLYNWLNGHNPWQYIYLWDDPADPDQLLGWALLSTPWSSFDVFVRPELWNSAWAGVVNRWVEEKSIEKAREQGHKQIWRMNVAETDNGLRKYISERCFQEVTDYTMLLMDCDLDRALPLCSQPGGYVLRRVKELDAANRAAAQHTAFKVDTPFEEYLQQYEHFIASPGYAKGCDWVVVAPDRCIVSFCIVWPDSVSRLGQVDPVGTHPDFQRQGFGKIILGKGLQYLQSVGMRSARLSVRVDNVAAIKLYESIGFRVTNKLLTYQKLL
jgi:mycothiol synthase